MSSSIDVVVVVIVGGGGGVLQAADAVTSLLCMQMEEINHLVASQGTAASAVRLEALLPIDSDPSYITDQLDRISASCFSFHIHVLMAAISLS